MSLNLRALEAAVKKAEEIQTRMEGRREAAVAALQALGFADVDAAREEVAKLRTALEEQSTALEQREAQLREKFPNLFGDM